MVPSAAHASLHAASHVLLTAILNPVLNAHSQTTSLGSIFACIEKNKLGQPTTLGFNVTL